MKTKVCPRCGSDNIEWIIPQNWSMWSCYNCEYTGSVIEVDDAVQKEIQREWKYHKDEVLKRFAHKDNEDYDEDISEEDADKKLDELMSKKD